MKTLEELGISPASWSNTVGTKKPFETNSVWDAGNGGVLTGGYAESVNDARLIAAAPELYECLREAVELLTHGTPTPDGIIKWRKALEKAGGAE